VWYVKEKTRGKYRQLFLRKEIGTGQLTGERYDQVVSPSGDRKARPKDDSELGGLMHEGWRVGQTTTLTTFGSGGSSYFPVTFAGQTYAPASNKGWLTTKDGVSRLITAGRVVATGGTIRYLRFIEDFPYFQLNNLWKDAANNPDPVYVVQTNSTVIARCLLMTTDPGDLVLDPTCGSGTAAYVAEQWGRRWITIDTSRVALALARTRLMCAKYPYYLLADSPEGVRKEAEVTGRMPGPGSTQGDVRKGFVYKRVPHVTLKSIANNPDIREGMSRAEIDAAIARHADTELLYDQPYEDAKHIRVAGPFTVESLSPHRVLPADSPASAAAPPSPEQTAAGQYELMVLTNLRKAGVQNTIKNERLRFERLDPYPGSWLQGAGEYKEGDTVKRVAVSIGPEFGTVGPLQVKEAAKEAVQGLGFDMLVVCAASPSTRMCRRRPSAGAPSRCSSRV
jgi:adenine-specific DNA-methyltransferase